MIQGAKKSDFALSPGSLDDVALAPPIVSDRPMPPTPVAAHGGCHRQRRKETS